MTTLLIFSPHFQTNFRQLLIADALTHCLGTPYIRVIFVPVGRQLQIIAGVLPVPALAHLYLVIVYYD